ncbi:hypothetical protein GA0070609_0480 [Micromonospora echinaurantiaca]|uniref:Uncharacterized protein n=1 Tax=Micromonospora echinaurantiaca TaxID=47857 RepID=A0A1C5GVM9_9ACTN|nr:hypothetical protein GA0070609_0480 [Micromonospora echinaurantiaca]
MTDRPVADTSVADAPVAGVPVADEPVGDEPDIRRLDDLLEDLYHGQERITQATIYRRAVAAELPAQLLTRIAALPEGEYSVDEAADLLGGSVT